METLYFECNVGGLIRIRLQQNYEKLVDKIFEDNDLEELSTKDKIDLYPLINRINHVYSDEQFEDMLSDYCLKNNPDAQEINVTIPLLDEFSEYFFNKEKEYLKSTQYPGTNHSFYRYYELQYNPSYVYDKKNDLLILCNYGEHYGGILECLKNEFGCNYRHEYTKKELDDYIMNYVTLKGQKEHNSWYQNLVKSFKEE